MNSQIAERARATSAFTLASKYEPKGRFNATSLKGAIILVRIPKPRIISAHWVTKIPS